MERTFYIFHLIVSLTVALVNAAETNCTLSNGTIVVTHFDRITHDRGNNLRCASRCSCDASCTGYLVTDAEPCGEIYQVPVEPVCLANAPSACYKKRQSINPTTVQPMSPDNTTTPEATTTVEQSTLEATTTVEQSTPVPQYCDIQGVFQRDTSNEMFVVFRGSNQVPRYDDIWDKYSLDDRKGTEIRSTFLPDLTANVTSMYQVKSGDRYLFVIINYVEVERHMEAGGTYNVQAGTCKLLQAEYGGMAPTTVDAADFDRNEEWVILLQGTTLFKFFVSTLPPLTTYSYVGSGNLMDPNNNIYPIISGSPPTAQIHAFGIVDKLLIAFAGADFYFLDYDAGGIWTSHGPMVCMIGT